MSRSHPSAVVRYRPRGLVRQTRWLFCGALLAALAVNTPSALIGVRPLAALGTVVGLLALGLAAVSRYRSDDTGWAVDVLDVLGLTVLAASSYDPPMTFGVGFPLLWARAIYGSTRSVALHTAGLGAAYATSLLLWPLVPGHVGAAPTAAILGTLPVFALTSAVARYLAVGLFARERAQRRSTVLAALGSRLLGLTDAADIVAAGWHTARELTDATPGLRSLTLTADAGGLRVTRATGYFVAVPERLSANGLPPLAAGPDPYEPAEATFTSTELDAAAGEPLEWMCLAVPGLDGAVVLMGAPDLLSSDALPAVTSALGMLGLALRSSAMHQDLHDRARTDGLTGLLNRSAFDDELGRHLAAHDAGDTTLLYLDLDGFKSVNDRLGHAAGDDLLREVGSRVTSQLSGRDVAARLGGDEFAVLLPGADVAAATELGQRLVHLLAQPVTLAGAPVRVGVSIGVAPVTPGVSAEHLTRRADVAMYAAKALGRGRVQLYDVILLEATSEAVRTTSG